MIVARSDDEEVGKKTLIKKTKEKKTFFSSIECAVWEAESTGER